MNELIYLATPYSHDDPSVMLQRFHRVNVAAAKFMKAGHMVYSPISHSHSIALRGNLPTDWDYWEKYDRIILSICKEVWVLQQEGWDQSKGVKAEIDIAKSMGLPVKYVNPVNLLIYE